jgi:DNA (cytosine-5)-methyltransferase 1
LKKSTKKEKSNFLDLFSGIGGFRLGAQWAGMEFENEFHSDIEKFPNKVYAKHFPSSIQLGDVTKIETARLVEYGTDWIITGGFPCQDISIAGKGAGLDGERSGLWFEMQRIISELQPRYAIMENVPALTFRGLDRVLGSLADIGYDASWTIISARDIGASHLRKRIWIIAYPEQRNDKELEIQQTTLHSEITEPPNRFMYALNHILGQATKSNCDGNGNGLPNQLDRIGACGNSIVPEIAKILFELCEKNLKNPGI